MRIKEVLEGKLPNKYKVWDILGNSRKEPREIRQTYNKCYNNRLKSPDKKRVTMMWAEFMLASDRNPELKDMLNFIIEYCKK